MTWNPNSETLTVDGVKVEVWDISTGAKLTTITVEKDMYRRLCWCPQGHQLAISNPTGTQDKSNHYRVRCLSLYQNHAAESQW
jgi:WD40 repeat protein